MSMPLGITSVAGQRSLLHLTRRRCERCDASTWRATNSCMRTGGRPGVASRWVLPGACVAPSIVGMVDGGYEGTGASSEEPQAQALAVVHVELQRGATVRTSRRPG
jgi:hypothetical protein